MLTTVRAGRRIRREERNDRGRARAARWNVDTRKKRRTIRGRSRRNVERWLGKTNSRREPAVRTLGKRRKIVRENVQGRKGRRERDRRNRRKGGGTKGEEGWNRNSKMGFWFLVLRVFHRRFSPDLDKDSLRMYLWTRDVAWKSLKNPRIMPIFSLAVCLNSCIP